MFSRGLGRSQEKVSRGLERSREVSRGLKRRCQEEVSRGLKRSQEVARGGLERSQEVSRGRKRRSREVSRGLKRRSQEVSRGGLERSREVSETHEQVRSGRAYLPKWRLPCEYSYFLPLFLLRFLLLAREHGFRLPASLPLLSATP